LKRAAPLRDSKIESAAENSLFGGTVRGKKL